MLRHFEIGEAALFRRLSSEAQVLLTPGSRCACPQSGWFRLCFAGHPVNVIEVAIQRLMCTLAAAAAGSAEQEQEQEQEQCRKASRL